MGWPKFPVTVCCAAGLFACGGSGLALAQDGSAFDNPDILRDGYKVDWVPANAVIMGEEPGSQAGLPGKLDWQLSLRGAYQYDDTGSHYQALAVPSASLTRTYARGSLSAAAEAELSRLDSESLRLSALRASLAGDYRLDSLTSATASLSLSRAQDSILNAAADVADTPIVTSGAAEGSLARQFGKLSLTLRGSLGRSVYGPTTLVDGSERDNAYRSSTWFGAGLRAGWQATLIVTVFADADLQRSLYDGASSSVGVRTDGYDTALRLGVSGKWQDRLEAEVSGGLGFVRYDEASLGSARTVLYDAALTWRPDETVAIRGGFATTFVPPGDSIAETRVEYAATLDGSYEVNSWLALRASAAWSQVRDDAGGTDTSYGFGAGADYTLNRHTTLNADYAFAHTEEAPDPARDAHRITLGVTFKR